MIKFDYSADGRIVGVRDTLSAFNEPSVPISAEVTELTGITNEMVAGQRIDAAAVTDFVDGSVISIAHNSAFDTVQRRRVSTVLARRRAGGAAPAYPKSPPEAGAPSPCGHRSKRMRSRPRSAMR
jgi:DNA polymerase-3 subunit epsilon